jgi:hypothetical protein
VDDQTIASRGGDGIIVIEYFAAGGGSGLSCAP